jgi:sulfide dehydrogenase cytochrome subunit
MKNARYFLIVPMLFLVLSVHGQDPQPIDLQSLIVECEGCHGPNGNSTRDDVPILAGRPATEIEEGIAEFYFYERHCPTVTPQYGDRPATPMNMCKVANTLSKEEVRALAQYFAGQ